MLHEQPTYLGLERAEIDGQAASEEPPRADHLDQDHAEREDVRPRVHQAPQGLLGRHVARLALGLDHQGDVLAVIVACDPEVSELHLAAPRHHDVLRADVAVDQVHREPVEADQVVGVVEGVGDPGGQLDRGADRDPRHVLGQGDAQPRQIGTVHQLEREVGDVVDLPEVEGLHDRRVREQRGQPGLFEEHLPDHLEVRCLGRDPLEHTGLHESWGPFWLARWTWAMPPVPTTFDSS